MLDSIDQTIATHHLVPDGTHILLAVSGGADSILLLHALVRLARNHDWRVTVAHLNHGLRGAQGSDDAAFVREQADAMNLQCYRETVDVRMLARRNRQSIEMAGRQARHDFFMRLSRHLDISRVATGHTADDRIETLLLNLARGTGMDALASIPYRTTLSSGLLLVRPLLDIARPDIEKWLQEHAYRWRNDPSNTNPVYRRNRVRHELLPWLESRLNPRVRNALQKLMQQATLDREWIETVAQDITRKCTIKPLRTKSINNEQPTQPALDRRRLTPHPAALRQRVIANWLQHLNIPRPRIDQPTIERLDRMLVAGCPGRIVLAGKTAIRIKNDVLEYEPPTTTPVMLDDREWLLPMTHNEFLDLDEPGLRVIITLETGPFSREGGRTPGYFPAQTTIRMPGAGDLPLKIRFRRPGDRLYPTGAGGSRKIQDILTDAKVPALERARIPLLVHGEDVVWLPGYRISKHWRVTNPNIPRLRIRIERK